MAQDTLGSRVRWLCQNSGVSSREELSDICGLSKSHLGLIILRGTTTIRSDVIQKITKTFGCSSDWLLAGAPHDSPDPDDVHDSVSSCRARAKRAKRQKKAA